MSGYLIGLDYGAESARGILLDALAPIFHLFEQKSSEAF
jgi:hypothetical protein